MLNELASKIMDAQVSTPALWGYAKYNLNQNFKLAVLVPFSEDVSAPKVTPCYLAPSPARLLL